MHTDFRYVTCKSNGSDFYVMIFSILNGKSFIPPPESARYRGDSMDEDEPEEPETSYDEGEQDLIEDEELSIEEAGFMEGYDKATDPDKED